MIRTRVSALTLAALLAAGPALAEPGSDPAADLDNDGTVTRAEFAQYHGARMLEELQANFAELDHDGDGKLTREEYIGAQMRGGLDSVMETFDAADENGDGVLQLRAPKPPVDQDRMDGLY